MGTMLTGTLIFFVLGAIATGLSYSMFSGDGKKNDRPVVVQMAITATVCMWLMWITIYMHQLNPIVRPERSAPE